MSEKKIIQCPKCQKRMKVKPLATAAKVTCPICQTVLKLPAASGSMPQSRPHQSRPHQSRSATASRPKTSSPTATAAAANPFALDLASMPNHSTGATQTYPQSQAVNPYQTPVSTSSKPNGGQLTGKRYREKPLSALCNVITVSILLYMIGIVIIAIIQTTGTVMFEEYNNPTAEVSSDLEWSFIGAHNLFAGLTSFAFLISVIASLIFLRRSNANLHASNVQGMEYTPGWAVGCWFIPILHLFRPYQITKEIWERSVGSTEEEESSLLATWWAFWIIGNIFSRIETRTASMDIGAWALPLSLTSSLFGLGAGVCFVLIVRGITQRQGF